MKGKTITLLTLVAVLGGSLAVLAKSSISWEPKRPRAGETVTFSYNGDHDPQKWCFDWSFSDCTKEASNQTSATHVYEQPGTHPVMVLEESPSDVSQRWISASVTVRERE